MVTILDTNILIDMAHHENDLFVAMNDVLNQNPAITVINKYEFLRGIFISNSTKEKKEKQISFLNQFMVYSFTPNTVQHCAELYSRLRKNGRLINELDILILGICVENRLSLITNDHDFDGMDQITGINIKVLNY